jgi:hypothetical protein
METSSGCVDIKPVVLNINPTPDLVVTNPNGICFPGNVDITDSWVDVNSLEGAITYWEDSLATRILDDPAAVDTSGYFYVKSTTDDGCSDTAAIYVTINPLPTLIVVNPDTVCAPEKVSITNTWTDTNNTDVVASYWLDQQNTVEVEDPESINESGTFFIKATSSEGCFDVEPVSVLINPSPKLEVTDPTAVCSPSTIDITNSWQEIANQNVSEADYWLDAIATDTLSDPTEVTSSGTYFIRLTSDLGCSDIAPVNVTIYQTPALISSSPPDYYCTPVSIDLEQFVVDTANATGFLQYWKDEDLSMPATNPVSEGGTYFVEKVTTFGGCTDVTSIDLDVRQTPPKPTVSHDDGIRISSANSGNQWFFGGHLIDGATERTFQPENVGDYSVWVTLDGCNSEMSDSFDYTFTGLENWQIWNRIYPNPVVNGRVIIESESRIREVVLVDQKGLRYKVNFEKLDDYTVALNLRKFSRGVYIVKVVLENDAFERNILIGTGF